MANAPTGGLKEFLDSNPTVDADKAKELVNDASSHFDKRCGGGAFRLYGQDELHSITARYQHPRAEVPPTFTEIPREKGERGAWSCDGCQDHRKIHDRKRHLNEVHIKDPKLAFFCPDPNCKTVLYRVESSPIDEHLATHLRFPNAQRPGSRAYAFLNSTERTVLKKLPLDALFYLARDHDRNKAEGVLRRRANVLTNIPAEFHPCLTISNLTVPSFRDIRDLASMKKDDLIEYIISLRQTVTEFMKGLYASERLAAKLGST